MFKFMIRMIWLTALLASISNAEDEVLPDLLVKQGEVVEIPAQRWVYSKVDIQPGAILKVTESSAGMLELIAQKDFILHGRIIAQDWSSDDTNFNLVLPNSKTVPIVIRSTNKGGDGGNGGGAGFALGGRGAKGAPGYGGGGGSGGVYVTYPGAPRRVDGKDATDERGAPKVYGGCGSDGSYGGVRSEHANGGVIYLEVHGSFDGTGGVIDVLGTQGKNGIAAIAGNGGGKCWTGSGGPGGGGPGGQGGIVVGYLAGKVINYPKVNTDAGQGGAPGKTVQDSTQATVGERGKAGWVKWFP